ncbi:hypothetical protein Tco_1298759 [Tanacetum coccineum]
MDLETAQTTTTTKLLILKQGEYDMWRLRIEQILSSTRLCSMGCPVTTEEKTQKKNDVKARNFVCCYTNNIIDLDVDAEVTLVDEAQGRNDDNLMFDTGVFDEQEVKVKKAVSTAEVTTVSATTTTVDELTLAQTLIEIKAAKLKAVTTTATTTTTVVTRPKARGVVVQEPSEFRTTTTSSQTSQLPHDKDKGKAKMINPEKPLKKKD